MKVALKFEWMFSPLNGTKQDWLILAREKLQETDNAVPFVVMASKIKEITTNEHLKISLKEQ